MRGTRNTRKRLTAAAAAVLAIGLQAASQAGAGVNDLRRAAPVNELDAGTAGGEGTRSGSSQASGGPLALPDLSPYDDSLREPPPAPKSRLTGFDQYNGIAKRDGTGLWLANPSAEIKGLGAALAPGASERGGLALNTAFLHQRAQAVPGALSPQPNNVLGVGLTANLWDRRVKLHGEYAASRRTETGTTSPLGGDAYELQMTLQPRSARLGQSPLHWRLSLDRRAADSDFWTLGEAPGGQLTERVAGDLAWSRFSSQLAYSRSRPRQGAGPEDEDWQQRQVLAQLNYAGTNPGWFPLGDTLLGQPQYTLRLERANAAAGTPVRLDTASVLASFDPGPWQWQLAHTRALGFDDEDSAVQRREESRLRLNWALPGSWVLTPTVFRQLKQRLRTHDDRHTIGAELLASVTILPSRLNARFNINSLRNHDEGAAATEEQARLESALDWLLRPQRGARPRVTLSLDGHVETRRSHGTADSMEENRYRVFARFEAAWPDA